MKFVKAKQSLISELLRLFYEMPVAMKIIWMMAPPMMLLVVLALIFRHFERRLDH